MRANCREGLVSLEVISQGGRALLDDNNVRFGEVGVIFLLLLAGLGVLVLP